MNDIIREITKDEILAIFTLFGVMSFTFILAKLLIWLLNNVKIKMNNYIKNIIYISMHNLENKTNEKINDYIKKNSYILLEITKRIESIKKINNIKAECEHGKFKKHINLPKKKGVK